MTDADLAYLPLVDQAQAIAERRLSPTELVRTYLARIERYDPGLRAFITVTADAAIEAARAAEREIAAGRYKGVLHGIPFAVKDQIAIDGVRVTGGSRLLSGNVADYDATVIRRLLDTGAILLGTLNTHEFHMGPTIDFPFGTPRNPWNRERNPGGSSSGSAAAIAAGLASFTLGGDTGGSVRAPAAWCGVVGFKPTWSRVSRHGVFVLTWSLDCVGPLARTVEDSATVLQAIAGRDENDPTSSHERVEEYTAKLSGDLRGLRVGVVHEMTAAGMVGDEARIAIERAVDVLRELGADIRPATLPLMTETRFLSPAITKPEAASYHRALLRERYEDFDFNTRVGLMVGAIMPAGVATLAQRGRMVVARQVHDALADVDVLVGAGSPGGAPPIEDRHPITTKKEALAKLYAVGTSAGQLTRVFSLAGTPAMSVPCGFTGDGMPLSLHIAGRSFDEATVLRVGHAYQQRTEWHLRRPAMG